VGPEHLGGRLIFLISQPRSGSTLLQRLLSRHPRIASLPEPWFMLHLLYAERREGLAAEYNARLASKGLQQFVASLPSGDSTYLEAVRAAALKLYDAALTSPGKQLFLDKTPRYYLVIPELNRAFPAATFLFLVRNPLDVFSSLLDAHAGGDWTRLARRDLLHDLVTAPAAIDKAISTVGGRKLLIRYEDLVGEPERALGLICETLGVDFDPAMLRYNARGTPGGRSLGDRISIHKHERPVTDYVGVWRRRLNTRWKRSLAMSYLRDIGPATLGGLGYEYRSLEDGLRTTGPIPRSASRRWRLISRPASERTWRDELWLAAARSIHERGWRRTALRALYIGLRGRPPNPRPVTGVSD
jgi:hypothetical protein